MITRTMRSVVVTVGADGLTPQAFRWDAARVRVLGVQSIEAVGAERRYGVRTRRGCFELSLFVDTGRWFVRRSPTRLGQLVLRWQSAPRYGLPAWRRRIRGGSASARGVVVRESVGGSHADGLALV